MSETTVSQTYNKGFNESVVVRDGRISKYTVWQTGVANSTQTINYPAPKVTRKK